MNQRTAVRVLIGVLVAVGIAAFFLSDASQYLTLEALREHRDALLAWAEAHRGLAVALYFLVYVAMAALSVPGAAVFTIAGGALFGLLTGTVVVSFASTVGATLVFLATRFLFRDAVQKRFRRRLERVNRGVEREGGFYLFALRLVPVFPFWVINLVMALTPIRAGTFYWVSQLGMLPATIVYVNAGTQLASVNSLGDILSPELIGAFALLGLLPLLLRWLLAFIKRRRAYRGFKRPKHFDYNLIVIGAGAAGLSAAYIGANARAKVALIEKNRMGGDCLNTGCIPSKALLRTAQLLQDARESERYGIRRMDAEIDFGEVMARVREVIRKIEPHDSRERYEGMGVDVFEDHARLVSPWEVEVSSKRISGRGIVLATGAEPLAPPIPGLDEANYLTSETIWNLDERPNRLVVLGGGPIGCELAQAFARLGSEVTVVEMADRLLPREDREAGEALELQFRKEGIKVATGTKATRVEPQELVCERDGTDIRFAFDELLVALGRRPRVEGFGAETLGVQLDERGTIATDGFQCTNFPNITVCGDAAGPYQFTHVAGHQAFYAATNALIHPFWSLKTDDRVIPWVTFTDPEVARVGLNEDDAREKGIEYEVTTYALADLDRAIADGADEGLVKVLTPPGKDRILGATIIGRRAGEMLPEFVLAMKHGLGLKKILGTIHVYPTLSEANKYAAGAWRRAHLSERVLGLAERFFRWRRS